MENKQIIFNEIERYLDEENCITYRKLSSQLNIQINQSKMYN